MMRSGRIPAKTENARKIWLLGLTLMIIGLGGSNVFAMDLLGPPTADLEKGMFRGGIEYSSSKMDLELIEGNTNRYRNGELLYSGPVTSLTIEDFKANTLYAALGYGIIENYEAFLRMGAVNAKFSDSQEDFDSEFNFAMSAGAKATFYEGFDWKIGGIFQINWAEMDGELESSSSSIFQPQFVEISTAEMQIAMGATYMYSDRVSIYGGPFAHFISGDFDYTFTQITETIDDTGEFTRIFENFDTGETSWEINEGPNYGVYIGAQVKFAKNYSANIEYQYSSNVNVFGANVMIRY